MIAINKSVLIKLFITLTLAIVSGCFLGLFYVNSCSSGNSEDLLPPELEIRDNMEKVLSEIIGKPAYTIDLKNKSPFDYVKESAKSVKDLSARDNYILAEHKLLNPTKSIKRTTQGVVKAMGVNQTLASIRYFGNNEYFGEEKSESSFVQVASRFYYSNGIDKVKVYNGSLQNGVASYTQEPTKIYTYNEYRLDYGIGPNFFLDYIVSSKTVLSQSYDGLVDGLHQYTLELQVQMCEKNYMYKIKKTASSNDFPVFKSVKLVYKIDDEWNMKEVKHFEEYGVFMPMLGKIDTKAELVDIFEYGVDFEIPKN